MNTNNISSIIKDGEGLNVEFKSALHTLPKNIFETVCSFLNSGGGRIYLGITDNGNVEGVVSESINKIKSDFVNGCNDRNRLNPTFYLTPEVIEYDDKKVIQISIPEGSQVHYSNSKIFVRNQDGDFNITDNSSAVASLYQKKQSTFSENRIYPILTLADFELDLLSRIRVMCSNVRSGHPWLELTDDALLKSAGLWMKDYQTGIEGYTLASVLLIGKESTIQNILPHYKTDAIVRINDQDRYDDRLDLRCNLFNSYFLLLKFIERHLPDKFYLDGINRISLRETIFREIVANLLVHREFVNHFPARIVIEQGKVITENSNRPHGNGVIDLANFSPFPKNPTIAKFFKEIGLVEELGSGIRNSYKFSELYSGIKPTFTEGDIFTAIIPFPSINYEQTTLEGAIPKVEGTIPKVEGAIPKVEGAIPKVEGAIPKVEGAILANKAIIELFSDAAKEFNLQRKTMENTTRLLTAIIEKEGENSKYYTSKTGIPEKSIERYIKVLRELGFIEFKGAKKGKSGGYYYTDIIKRMLNQS